MEILAVDDERMSLAELVKAIHEAVSGVVVHEFLRPGEALEYMKTRPCDVAFLDIQMRGMSGIEMAKELKNISPNINVIFVTGYSNYGVEAMELRASGYLMKPVIASDITEELANLRHSVVPKAEHPIRVQTFGNFDVFYHDVPLQFGRKHSKEILAYLVDIKGTSATFPEVASIIWED